jgi:DNA repair protein RadC
MGTRIKEWPSAERPRERLLRFGSQTLTDAELLAILLRTGSGNTSALDLAREILGAESCLRSVAARNAPELMRLPGIGPAKAVGLLAAFEVGRRIQADPARDRQVLRTPLDVVRAIAPSLRDRRTEVFLVLVLDAKNGLKRDIELSSGTLNASLVHPREVFKAAIDHLAAAIIVAHNHPSGNPEPSREDIEITRQIAEAGKIVGIPLHDHVIIAGDRYASMAEQGLF